MAYYITLKLKLRITGVLPYISTGKHYPCITQEMC